MNITRFVVWTAGLLAAAAQAQFRAVPLASRITGVQPMTGIVMWDSLKNAQTDAIQLEYSYLRYGDVVQRQGEYDWTPVESKLAAIAARKHQAVLRFWDTYPGRPSSVPEYIKQLPDYKDTVAKSEGRDTGFPDWSHPEYQRFFLEFYENFAGKYDRDPRLAFLQTGFGLWAEYHIYSGPEIPGATFPSLEFQARFFRHLAKVFRQTPWMISQDAQVAKRTPFAAQPELLKLDFGVFDDTFHLAWQPSYNRTGWEFFGRERYRRSPAGGEILFPNKEREQLVAANWARQVSAFESGAAASRVTVTNTGVAPIYFDAYVAVNGVRAKESLKLLQPGESRRSTAVSGGNNPRLSIECDRLVPGQRIEFEADLKGNWRAGFSPRGTSVPPRALARQPAALKRRAVRSRASSGNFSTAAQFT